MNTSPIVSLPLLRKHQRRLRYVYRYDLSFGFIPTSSSNVPLLKHSLFTDFQRTLFSWEFLPYILKRLPLTSAFSSSPSSSSSISSSTSSVSFLQSFLLFLLSLLILFLLSLMLTIILFLAISIFTLLFKISHTFTQ